MNSCEGEKARGFFGVGQTKFPRPHHHHQAPIRPALDSGTRSRPRAPALCLGSRGYERAGLTRRALHVTWSWGTPPLTPPSASAASSPARLGSREWTTRQAGRPAGRPGLGTVLALTASSLPRGGCVGTDGVDDGSRPPIFSLLFVRAQTPRIPHPQLPSRDHSIAHPSPEPAARRRARHVFKSMASTLSHAHLFRPDLDTPCALVILNTPSSFASLERVWKCATYRVAADGAANRLYRTVSGEAAARAAAGPSPSPASAPAPPSLLDSFLPDLICGDWDSVEPVVEDFYRSRGVPLEKDPDQDSTDLMKCLARIERRQAGLGARVRRRGGRRRRVPCRPHPFLHIVSLPVPPLHPSHHPPPHPVPTHCLRRLWGPLRPRDAEPQHPLRLVSSLSRAVLCFAARSTLSQRRPVSPPRSCVCSTPSPSLPSPLSPSPLTAGASASFR
jgi:thiamine pyrophosphokinase